MFSVKGKGLAIPVILSLCLVFFSWSFVKVFYFPFVKREIGEGGTLFAYLDILFIALFLFFAFYFFVWRRKLIQNDKSLKDLRSKIGFITTHDNVVIMQYDISSKRFIRWNDKEGTEYRSFSVDDYWSYIHPSDMAIAQKLVHFMDSREDTTYSCEYRYRFPGMDGYSWQSNDIFPYQKDRVGKIISYIGVCRKNNRWHDMQDQLLRFHKDMDSSLRHWASVLEFTTLSMTLSVVSIRTVSSTLIPCRWNSLSARSIRMIVLPLWSLSQRSASTSSFASIWTIVLPFSRRSSFTIGLPAI